MGSASDDWLKKNLYEPADFFLARIPNFSLQLYSDVIHSKHAEDKLIDLFTKEGALKEALQIASPKLYQSLESKKYLNCSKEKEQIIGSLLKYLARSCTRCTPFGLFSSVGKGSFDNQSDISFNSQNLRKQARPDMGWMESLVEKLSLDKKMVEKVQIMTNPSVVFYGSQAELLCKKDAGKVHKKIQVTELARFIFDYCESSKSYLDVEKAMFLKYSDQDIDRLKGFLWTLVENGFLLTQFCPSTHSLVFFKKLEQMLAGVLETPIDGFKTDLIKAFENYNTSPFESDGKAYQAIAEIMSAYKSDHYMQVDTVIEDQKMKLNQSLKDELAFAASILVSNTSKSTFLDKYHLAFLEKYGTDRLVPFLELIDECKGLGFPLTENLNQPSFKKTIRDKLDQCLSSSHPSQLQEIDLSYLIEKEFIEGVDFSTLPPSLEMYCEVLASNLEEIDAGNYEVLINSYMATEHAGKTFGRFLHYFDLSDQKTIREFVRKIPDPFNRETVEASFLPLNLRTANVSLTDGFHDYKLDFGFYEKSKNQITLSDIYVGAFHSRLYLFSKKLNKEISVCLASAINSSLTPKFLQLLLQISSQPFLAFTPSIWSNTQKALSYLPRLRYKNIIFSPARWKIEKKSLPFEISTKNPKASIPLFKSYLEKEGIPKLVFLTYFDQRISIDISNQYCLLILINQLLKKEEMTLCEQLQNESNSWVKGENGKHLCEMVVPLKKRVEEKTLSFKYPRISEVSDKERVSFPGSDWVYLKIYFSEKHQDKFITNSLNRFMSFLSREKLIHKGYFIRYADPKPHLRVRLNIDPEFNIYPIINRWCENLMQERAISSLSIDTYEREIERYGGVELFPLVEDLFVADSFCVLQLLNLKNELKEVVIATLSALHLLISFGLSLDEILAHFSAQAKDLELLKGFREYRSELMKGFNYLFDKKVDAPDKYKKVFEALALREQSIFEFKEKLELEFDQNFDRRYRIINSILHMSMNRLLGVSQDKERRVRAFLNKLVFSFQSRSFSKKNTVNSC